MHYADDSSLGNVRMADGEVFKIDGRDPLAPGFDHILGSVGDLHVAMAVDMGDVARIEPAFVVELFGTATAIIGTRNCGAAHLETAKSRAIPRQFDIGVVGDLHLDAERRGTLL